MQAYPQCEPLNLPPYPFKLKESEGKLYIFDEIRKKHLVCTPEEWVRQHLVQYLILHKGFPKSLISLESGLRVNELKRRSDILIYNQQQQKLLLAECKAPKIKINHKTFDQIVAYNSTYNVPYLLVSNGLVHYCCKIDYVNNNYTFLDNIPVFTKLIPC